MNCRDIENLIQMAIDDILSEQGRQLLFAHLEQCPACAATYQEYLQLDALLKEELPAVTAPIELKADIMAALPALKSALQPTATKPIKKRRKNIIASFALVATAAVLLLLAGISGWFGDGDLPLDPNIPIADVDDNVTEPIKPRPQPDDTANPGDIDEATNPEDANQPEDTTNNPDDIITASEPDNDPAVPYSGVVQLPQVMHGSANHAGALEIYTEAAFTKYDAISPRIIDNTITFYTYIEEDERYMVWNADLVHQLEPVYVGEETELPRQASVKGFKDKSADKGFSYVEALSPDGYTLAYSQAGEEAGIYLLDQANPDAEPIKIEGAAGGGKILLWAPDSNNFVFTTEDGHLAIYHVQEKRINDLYTDGTVDSVCWSADSKTIVFSAMNPATGKINIFSATLPQK